MFVYFTLEVPSIFFAELSHSDLCHWHASTIQTNKIMLKF